MKAFALHTIMHPAELGVGKQALAGTVFETNADEYDRLEAMQAVRKPTKEELAFAKENDVDTTVVTAKAKAEIPAGKAVVQAAAAAPDSGDENDPKSKPKGATKKAKVETAEGEQGAGSKDDDI